MVTVQDVATHIEMWESKTQEILEFTFHSQGNVNLYITMPPSIYSSSIEHGSYNATSLKN